MGYPYDDKSTWADRIVRMIDKLCDLLSDYEYGNASQYDIIKTETSIFEIVNEYIPRLLLDLDEFFDYIHVAIRNNTPLDEREIEAYVLNITNNLYRQSSYTQYYLDYTDDQTKYQLEAASSRDMQRLKTEREYINQMIESDQLFDEEESKKITIITREEQLASAKERKDNIINNILHFMKKQMAPVHTESLYHKIPGATHQLIKYFRLRPEIIDYKDKLILGSNLLLSSENKAALKEAVHNIFFIDKIHTSEEIYRQLVVNHSALLDTLYINNSYGLFSVLQYLFPKDFIYVRPRIALPGQTITKPLENIMRFISGRYKTNIEDLSEYIDNTGYDLTVSLSLINKLPNIIIIDRNTLAPKDELHLTNEQLQRIVTHISEELRNDPEKPNTLAIRDLTCITFFPTLNLPLTEWLLYSILTKYDWPGKKKDLALYAFYTSPHLSRAIPIISTNQIIDKETRQNIAAMYEGQGDVSMSMDDLSNLDELIEDEIEFDWDLEALEEEEESE